MGYSVGDQLRVVSLLGGPTAESLIADDRSDVGAAAELIGLPESRAQVVTTALPKLEELAEKLRGWNPNVLHLCGGVNGGGAGLATQPAQPVAARGLLNAEGGTSAFVTAVAGLDLHLVYLDAANGMALAESLRASGVSHVIAWPSDRPPLTLPAMHFAHAFFALLRNPTVTVPEAFCIATHLTQAFTPQGPDDGSPPVEPPLPRLLSADTPSLPGPASVPPPEGIVGVEVDKPLHECLPGYEELRLLAPHAEVRLLLMGPPSMSSSYCMGHFCHALRGLLAIESRRLTVASSQLSDFAPGHLPTGASAMRMDVRTASGASASVVLGGPLAVLQADGAAQYALRQTMTADAQAVQLKLPPPGTDPPVLPSSAEVAAGGPVVEALCVCSVWMIQVLKEMAQDSLGSRVLVVAGIAAISTTPTVAFTTADAKRFAAVVTNKDPTHLRQNGAAEGDAAAAAKLLNPLLAATPALEGHPLRPASAVVLDASGTPVPGTASPAASSSPECSEVIPVPTLVSVAPWRSSRPPIASLTEEAFISDLIAFLTDRQGRHIAPSAFPEAVLNGSRLDLYNLYREVCRRGGYKMGNGINWKGQVFPRMRNHSPGHKMTGVGAALKRHYQVYLLEYEMANSADVQRHQCAICQHGDGWGLDWVCCDCCEIWVHFACDKRPYLGAFKDYARFRGRTYMCPRCYESKMLREATIALAKADAHNKNPSIPVPLQTQQQVQEQLMKMQHQQQQQYLARMHLAAQMQFGRPPGQGTGMTMASPQLLHLLQQQQLQHVQHAQMQQLRQQQPQLNILHQHMAQKVMLQQLQAQAQVQQAAKQQAKQQPAAPPQQQQQQEEEQPKEEAVPMAGLQEAGDGAASSPGGEVAQTT